MATSGYFHMAKRTGPISSLDISLNEVFWAAATSSAQRLHCPSLGTRPANLGLFMVVSAQIGISNFEFRSVFVLDWVYRSSQNCLMQRRRRERIRMIAS